MLGRRSFLAWVGGAAVALITKPARGSGGKRTVPPATPAAKAAPPAPPRSDHKRSTSFLGLRAGDQVEAWRIDAVEAVKVGGVAIVLRADGHAPFQVDVLRRDDDLPGVAATEHLSLYVVNQGRGRAATDEDQARGALALAAALGEGERAGVPAELMTLRQRSARYPDGVFCVL